MKYAKLLGFAFVGALALGTVGCKDNLESKAKQQVIERKLNDETHALDEYVSQNFNSFLKDGVINIAVVSDIEGAIQNAKTSAKKLRNKNLDAIIIAGDNYENENIRKNPLFPHSTNNVQEMVNSIMPYAQLNVPVFVIAGNHERQSVYFKAIKQLQNVNPHVFDINQASVDLHGVNIVGMGGYHDPRFITPGGFQLKDKDYKIALRNLLDLQRQNEPTIFVTHGPPNSHKTPIDYVARVGHVGDMQLSAILMSGIGNIINVHGHIHEGGRNTEKYAAGIAINVAAITSYNNKKGTNIGLITISNGKFSYENVND